MHRVAPLLMAALCFVPLASAQSVAARSIAEVRAGLPHADPRWFELGLEQARHELEWDVSRALRTSVELVDAVRDGDPDRRSVAAMLALLSASSLQGPTAARTHQDWLEWSSQPPSDRTSPALRGHYFTARSAAACNADDPYEELKSAVAALEAVPSGGPLFPRMLAVSCMHHITDDIGGALDAEVTAELELLADDPALASRAAWCSLHDYLHLREELDYEQKATRLDAVRELARQLGDLRTEISVVTERARIEDERNDSVRALEHLNEALALAEQGGFVVVVAAYYQIASQILIESGRLDEAAALLDEAGGRVEGLGMPTVDGSLLETRFNLAVSLRDAELVLELTDDMEQWRQSQVAMWGNYGALQEEVLSAQRQRIEDEHHVREAGRDREEQRASLLRGVGYGSLGVLAFGVVLALRSRRRLILANRRLQVEIERAENAVRAREALEERMRQIERTESLGLFASGIAHDFNNLMVGVMGNAELLELDERDPRRLQLLGAITGAGERAARLCAQLQTYAGGERVELAPVDFARLLREIEPVLRAAVGSGVEVTSDLSPELLVVDGARSQLEQAVLNLVVNARDAKARHVQLRASRLSLPQAAFAQETPLRAEVLLGLPGVQVRGELRPGEFVVLEVSDDGEGMSPELVERIFDPFFSTRFPGRGLGLAVVFGVMRRHGAVIAVTSKAGGGTSFRLLFPRSGAPLSETGPAERVGAALPRRVPRLQVLVVDDEADVRDFLVRALGARGHTAATATDLDSIGRALASFGSGPGRVALVDLTLPTLDGRDVVRALRRLASPPAIVLMSGHATTHLEQLARELDVEGFISKPFTSADLERELARAIEVQAARTTAK
ncbi:MAG: ATP-binding protein [Planctomycetota bacterium]|nr:ATP-binding protein [Planctomycetota bacterium]